MFHKGYTGYFSFYATKTGNSRHSRVPYRRVALNFCGSWLLRGFFTIRKISSLEKKFPQKFSPQKFSPVSKLYLFHRYCHPTAVAHKKTHALKNGRGKVFFCLLSWRIIILEQENKNTAQKTERDVRLLERFLKTKNEDRKIEDIPAVELNEYISQFIISVCTKDGNPCKKSPAWASPGRPSPAVAGLG